MRKMIVVALREYKAAVKTKTFIITIVAMPLLMGGSLIAQMLLSGIKSSKTKSYAVVDRTPNHQLTPYLTQAIDSYNRQQQSDIKKPGAPLEIITVSPSSADERAMSEQRLALSERVRSGELSGILEIGSNVLKTDKTGEDRKEDPTYAIRYQTDKPTARRFYQLSYQTLLQAIQKERAESPEFNISIEKLTKVTQPVALLQKGLTRQKSDGSIVDDDSWSRYVTMGVPIFLIILMFMVVMIGATPLMQGVLEEKMQRIAEVLLGSVKPFELMMGKLIGMSAVSMTISAVYLSGGVWAGVQFGFGEFIPFHILFWFVIFQILASLMFGSLFIAIGAACTEMKETQNLMFPIMMIVCIPMFVLGPVMEEPNGPVANVMSFFPFATPMLMVARMCIPPGIPMWQPLAGIVVSLAMTVLCVYAAGRIFRVGILMQGKGAKMTDLFKWIFRG